MTSPRTGVDAVNQRNISGRPVDKQHRSTRLFFYVFGNDALDVTAYEQIGSAHYRSMDGVIGNQGDRLVCILLHDLQNADPTIDGSVRVHPQSGIPFDIPGSSVDIGLGVAPSHTKSGWFHFRFGFPDSC